MDINNYKISMIRVISSMNIKKNLSTICLELNTYWLSVRGLIINNFFIGNFIITITLLLVPNNKDIFQLINFNFATLPV